MIWTIPNILTMTRLLAAPGVAVMFLYFDRPYADWFALLLFLVASITDWFDGYLARIWRQETKFGAMLDPIADKAMVVIALMVIVGYSSMSPWLVLPATFILFREVFISGLREFVGNNSVDLRVTVLAKWKTTSQMLSIALLFAQGVVEHYALKFSSRKDGNITGISQNSETDQSTKPDFDFLYWLENFGLVMLWIAAILTLITGFEYFKKAIPKLREGK
ncbi:CDP-diacylglycerol--glycerol-3-phosphate 3-phosphatidyltransferase [Paracoccaceae bacterium]|nr:CDP-diacylglycerol--glycerol-3-phosphate 3-phosphatidyltransferase [Paracoccaceae bacterium]MDB3860133.1 CDP-diacylglycerol--glycerol-3-phosphate 3-phosphatidyltransferase [Paracoccaceae bacterium]